MNYDFLLTNLYHLTYLPYILLEKGQPVTYYPDSETYKKLIKLFDPLNLKYAISGTIGRAVIADCLYFGEIKIKNSDYSILVGPALDSVSSMYRVRRLLNTMPGEAVTNPELLKMFDDNKCYYSINFASLLSFVNCVFNNEVIATFDLVETRLGNIEQTEKSLPNEILHNTQQYENQLYSYIKYGQPEQLQEFIKVAPTNLGVGRHTHNNLRQIKNMIICSSVLSSRSAVAGGAPYNAAMSLTDSFMMRLEDLYSEVDIANLHFDMLLSHARLVANSKIKHANSMLASKINAYIRLHLKERITVEEIAESFKVSQSYLSQCFKKEAGINLSQFITQCKIDEVKHLLVTTNMSIIEIAYAMSFSSQAHMQTAFKKVTGTTPKKFREDRNNFLLF